MMVNQFVMPLKADLEFTDADPSELLMPVEDYALHILPDAFENFTEVILPLTLDYKKDNVFDVTVFYSRRRGLSIASHDSLQMHNQHAFDAAKKAYGLLIYYQGHLLPNLSFDNVKTKLNLDFTPDCMSFCIWQSLDAAKAGSRLSAHQAAVNRVDNWYEGFAIKKYEMSVNHEAGKKSIVLREVKLQH